MPDEIQEQDGFILVDLSKYQEPWTPEEKTGEASPVAEVSEEEFIPSTWRDSAFEFEVEREVRRNFIRQAALEKVREIQHGKIDLPPIHLLTEFLQQPDNPIRYVVEDLWPVGGNVLFAAGAKWGKSSSLMCLLRSLADGDALFDHFSVTSPIKPGEGILVFDLEMNEDRVRRELRLQGIKNTGCLHIVPMRGATKHLDIAQPKIAKLWVNYCRANNIRTLIIDPLAPLLGYLNIDENDNTGINRFFQQLDELKKDAGIRDLLITHHCGHTGDWRPRGASRFNDWPDALWLAKLDGDITDPSADRLFFARGRDVGDTFNSPGRMTMDLVTRRITFTDDVNAAQQAALQRGVMENLVWSRPGLVTRNLVSEVSTALGASNMSLSNGKIQDMLETLADEGVLHNHKAAGRGGPVEWYVDTSACPHCPTGDISD